MGPAAAGPDATKMRLLLLAAATPAVRGHPRPRSHVRLVEREDWSRRRRRRRRTHPPFRVGQSALRVPLGGDLGTRRWVARTVGGGSIRAQPAAGSVPTAVLANTNPTSSRLHA
jgi:hypothetical protein